MAILVAVGGALLGNALGIGANIGWILGAVVGTLLFPPETATTETEGPRLGDLTVTSSAYGAPRAVGFGTVRMGGNIIWANEIREEKRTRTVSSGGKGKGGKGGSEQKITEYYYYGSFTVAFGEGEAKTVRRIWADGKLIYDVRGNTVRTQKKGHRFRIYKGTEDQGRDPMHTNREGAALTPAYRGTVMIAFDDIPLKDYGNRLPNITAEIVYQGPLARNTSTVPVSEWAGIPLDSFANTHYGINWERQWFFLFFSTTSGGNGTAIARVNMETLTVEQWRHDNDCFAPLFNGGGAADGFTKFYTSGPLHCLKSGDLICHHSGTASSSSNSQPFALIDGATLMATDSIGVGSTSLTHTPTKPYTCDQIASSRSWGSGEIHFAASGILGGPPWIGAIRDDQFVYLWDNDTANFFTYQGGRNSSTIAGLSGEGFCDFWQMRMGGTNNNPTNYLYRYRSTEGAFYAEVDDGAGGTDPTFSGVDAGFWKEFVPTDVNATWLDFAGGGQLYYDQTDDTLLILFYSGTTTPAADDDPRMIKYDYQTDTILWISDGFNNAPTNSANDHNQARITRQTIGWHISSREYELDTTTGEFIENNDVGDFDRSEDGFGEGAYDAETRSFVSAYYDTDGQGYLRAFFGRYTAGGQTLSTIVADVLERVGLTSADYAVADLSSVTVPGYYIGRQTNARSAIEPLQNFFLFDGVESDHALKFFIRGKSASRTITQDEFGIGGEDEADYTENRVQEQELPEVFSITYMDEAADYQQQHHIARRILRPSPAMNSRNKLGIQLNAVLTPSQAKQQAEKALYSAWIERSTYSFKLPWTHIDLDPADVVNVNFDNGTSAEVRLAKMDIAEGLVIEADAISQKPAQFLDSGVTADGHQGFSDQVVKDTDAIRGWVVDVPLLRDADADTERLTAPVYYWQSGFGDGFYQGGNLYVGFNTLDYSLAGELGNETPWGSTRDVLGDPVDGAVFQTDVTNSLTLIPVVGGDQLSSITQSELLLGLNAILLLKRDGTAEVINFQNATTNADGTITIDTLLRGRRGTDTFAFNHTAGETWLYLSNFTGDKFGLSLDFADGATKVYFRHVGAGQMFQEGDNDIMISEARPLKPYAPVNYTATVDGSDIDLTWDRRTRYGGPLRDNYGTVPLNEDSEEYEIEIFDGPGGTLLRTVTGVTTEAYTYTSANITTDFGSIPSTLTFKVYQISAQVGRGFSYEETVDVL